MTSQPLRIRRGQYVRTWFDTGALGASILYGVVVAAGAATYSVRWESGTVNRVRQGQAGIERVTGDERATAEAATAIAVRDDHAE
jgi:hypothetical protein